MMAADAAQSSVQLRPGSFQSVGEIHRRLPRKGGGGHHFRCLELGLWAHPPADQAHPPAPLRDDVPLLDPCSGQLSAGAEVDLGIKGRRRFIDFVHVPSALRVPPGLRDRPQTPRRSSIVTHDMADDKAWNSRRIPDATLRARLGGRISPVKVRTVPSDRLPPTTSGLLEKDDIGMQVDDRSSREWKEDAVRRFVYTSSTQRSYQEVDWDAKLPRRFKAPTTTLEKMADPVSQCSSRMRYHSSPQLWQVTGTQRNRHQIRARNDIRKPISFCSPSSKSGQMPLYCGTIGSENMDAIDDPGEAFHPNTLRRCTVPAYTPTTYRTTIPGYTGKGIYAHSARNTELTPPAHSSGMKKECLPVFARKAPLSKMVTTMAPRNPFLKARPPPQKQAVKIK